MFAVCEFPSTIGCEKTTVSVVSSTWIETEESCLWPLYNGAFKLASAIKSHEEPGPNWLHYKCRILEGKYW